MEVNFGDLIERFDYFLFDCDGVIWTAKNGFEEAISTINKLIEIGKEVFFVTNSSAFDEVTLQEKAIKYGLKGVK